MNIKDILTSKRTYSKVTCNSKKRALEKLSELIASSKPAIEVDDLFHQIIERERLGSTGIGNGIAIPHCRFSTNGETICALMTLDTPIDFDAIDNKPVDIIFAMLVPEDSDEQHLKTLATLAELLQQEEYVTQLRASSSDQQLYDVAIGS